MSMLIRLLGPVEVHRYGTVTRIGAPKRRAMLAVLALSANQPVSLDVLIETLWDDDAPESAMKNLRSHAHALRTIVGSRLVTRSAAYELQLDVDELDTTLFASLADRGAAALAAGDTVGAVAAYGEALALWRGVALHGVPRTVRLDASVAGLLDRRLGVYEEYCDARLAGGAAGELIPGLREHLAGHPFRERAWGALMRAQYRSGDIPGALASFAQAQDLLREQLGVDPGPELVELHRAILARDPRLMRNPPTDRPRPATFIAHLADRGTPGTDGVPPVTPLLAAS
jgi:DNA-binding SARP family transcriptional activator